MQSKRVSSLAFSSRSLKKESQGSSILLEAGMGKILGLHVRQQVPVSGFRGTVRAKPCSLRLSQLIMAERVFCHKTRAVENLDVFGQLSRALRLR